MLGRLEQKLQAVVRSAGKQPMAWEEMHTATKVADPTTIINAWSKYISPEIAPSNLELRCSFHQHLTVLREFYVSSQIHNENA